MKNKTKSPWAWVPSLYFAEGIPYVIVMTVAVIMYKRLGISNTDIAIYTSWLYLPWVIKPLWSPIVDMFKTKRWWIISMQLLIGAGLAGIALTIPAPAFFQYTLAVFWLIAFSSATHDIAADGFYMLGLDENKQAYFIGIRSTFYRGAMITGQGLLIILAGFFETYTGLDPIKFDVQTNVSYQVNAPATTSNQNSALHFNVNTNALQIAHQTISKSQADSMRQLVNTHNVTNGFVKIEQTNIKKEVSWWTRTVTVPLAASLKKFFGRDQVNVALNEEQGNMGIVEVKLSNPPAEGEIRVLNLSQTGGDNSIGLVSSDRLEFTASNWSTAALLLIQIDPKLKVSSMAHFEGRSGNIPLAWCITFAILSALFLAFCAYHKFALPHPVSDKAVGDGGSPFVEFFATFSSFFKKENIVPALLFILLFRFGEAQLVKIASPFLLDARGLGGLGLTTGDVGLVYGTFGILALTIGGIIGGIVASKHGLKKWILWMTLAINLPTLTYVYLCSAMPDNLWIVSICVAIEQLGYGFGFTAYMLFLIYFCEGKHKTAHYALCTGLMALGMMIPGMFSGWIQDIVGYHNFFIWVVVCGVPSVICLKFLKIDPFFGLKKSS